MFREKSAVEVKAFMMLTVKLAVQIKRGEGR
jgi:hypothetical protein